MLLPTAVTVVIELAVWIVTDSLAMLAGAAHLLLDLAYGAGACTAAAQSVTTPSKGYRVRLRSVLFSTVAITLVFVFFFVLLRGPHRLLHPVVFDGTMGALVGPVGLLLSLIFLGEPAPCNARGHRSDPGRWLGTIAATAICAGALVGLVTGHHRIDTIVAIIAMIILFPRIFILVLRYQSPDQCRSHSE